MDFFVEEKTEFFPFCGVFFFQSLADVSSLWTPLRSAITAQRGGIVDEISFLFFSNLSCYPHYEE